MIQFVSKLESQFSSILVIDNNSSNYNDFNKELNFLRENSKTRFLKNSLNIGLASAQNQGAKYAVDNFFQAFCIFDQDSDIELDFLDVLLDDYNLLISKDVAVGAIGPSVVDRSSGISYPIAIYDGIFLKRHMLKEGEIAECSYIISSGSLISTQVWMQVGTFLDILFINYIDIEWCFRSSSKGFKVYTSNNTKIIQQVGLYRKSVFGRSIPVHNPIRRYYAARNSVFMLFLPHMSIGYKFREIFFNPMRLIFDCILEGNVRHRVYYFIKGVYDGIRHV